MTGNNASTPQDNSSKSKNSTPDEGTVLDRIKMPPMSGEEALRRFHENGHSSDGQGPETGQSDFAGLHPVMKLVSLGGTLLMITALLLGVLYLFGA
ncbi:MAG: hypothetical protein VX620_18370 [Pseudomonadota bacterium]|nr:hypothetical protein [Pseudomonadota bacterium]